MEEFPRPEPQPVAAQTETEPTDVSYELLSSNPELYRNQLMLLLNALPWDRPMLHVEGMQASELVRYCAASDNIELVPEAEATIYAAGTASLDDTRGMLDELSHAVTDGVKMQISRSEQAIRKRLLVWVEHFDQLSIAQAPQNANEQSSTDKHAA